MLLRTNLKKMIDKILTRWVTPIVTDRLVVEGNTEDPVVLVQPDKIKQEIAHHFTEWMEDPNPNTTITPEWIAYYES